jgi:transposase
MIVIGVDVHKQSVTAVAVDEAGRMLDERTVLVGSDELIGWASALDAERLWAIEDCRLLTPCLGERGQVLRCNSSPPRPTWRARLTDAHGIELLARRKVVMAPKAPDFLARWAVLGSNQ